MHAPKDLHDKYRKLYPQFDDTIGTYSGPAVENPVAAFPAMLEHLDNGVGRILALLNELDIERHTLVMLTSDNGPHREGGHDPVFWDSNGPLKGIKRDLYEGGIRVPFLARWPGTIAPGSTSRHVSAFWDMLPTFCEIAGVEIPDDTDGISLLAALQGRTQRRHDYLYWEFLERGGAQAIRKGDFKAVRVNVGTNPDARIELYDLSRDLAETTDVADRFPKVVEDMRTLFFEARTDSATFRLFKNPRDAPGRRQGTTKK